MSINEYNLYSPKDLSDFKRCEIFLKATNKTEKNIKELNISEDWNELANNWSQISYLIKDNKNEEAYSLLKDCLNHAVPKSKNKP